MEQAPNDQAKARLMAVAHPESGAWLNALTIASLCLHMSDDVVRIAAGLRLGVPLCQPIASKHMDLSVYILYGIAQENTEYGKSDIITDFVT